MFFKKDNIPVHTIVRDEFSSSINHITRIVGNNVVGEYEANVPTVHIRRCVLQVHSKQMVLNQHICERRQLIYDQLQE